MYHDLLHDASFWTFLFSIDQDLAERTRKQGCPCGGCLHRADYPRKPRGGGKDLPESYRHRLSFCCASDGCRKRLTPPSVRFLGRKVYLGAVVILVAAMREGPSPRRVGELSRLFGVDRRTIMRWRVFWRDHFPRTTFWKVARSRFMPPLNIRLLSRALFEAFVRADEDRRGWGRLLRFLAPITTAQSPPIAVSGQPG